MNSKEEFFRLTVIAAGIRAESAVRSATDPISLHGRGIAPSAVQKFVEAIRPVAAMPEFQDYVRGEIVRAYQYLFSMVDGICGFATDVHYTIVDERGLSIGDDLHFDFEGYLQTHGHTIVTSKQAPTRSGE
jgi:hypothetical protein